MGWKIVTRRLGSAGGAKQRARRQRQWDHKYGPDEWSVGFLVEGAFVPYEQALIEVYQRSYDAFLDANPHEVVALTRLAARLRNPHAEATGGVDLQVPAILDYLRRRGLGLEGREIVDIGSYGEASHPISVRLSPLTIPAFHDPGVTLERFWQQKKCLAVWSDAQDAEGRWRRDRGRA